MELFVSSCVHMLYGFYILSTAIAYDLSQALYLYLKPNMNVEVQPLPHESYSAPLDDLPPIVLVHGIFGFGQGVG